MSGFRVTEGALRRALCEGGISPVFQPVVRAPDGRPAGLEILARWHLPDGSVVPPDRFISQATRSGLETALARTLMEQAAPTVRPLAAASGQPVIAGFNAGPGCLADRGFAAACAAFLAHCRGTQAGLAVEITEREPLTPDLLPALCRLRVMGIKIVLDDFGTGYATGDVLPWLRPDVVKLDRSLTARAGKGDPGGLLERALRLLERSGVEILAEGVETPAEYRFLAARGIRLYQGYLFGRPVTGDRLTESLRDGVPVAGG